MKWKQRDFSCIRLRSFKSKGAYIDDKAKADIFGNHAIPCLIDLIYRDDLDFEGNLVPRAIF
jgi:hypothetical protein